MQFGQNILNYIYTQVQKYKRKFIELDEQIDNIEGGVEDVLPITTEKLADDAVTTDKIADMAVTNDKIDDDAIGTSQIVTGAVTSDKIASSAVTSAKIDSNAVTSAKIASGAVTSGKIANSAVTADKIATVHNASILNKIGVTHNYISGGNVGKHVIRSITITYPTAFDTGVTPHITITPEAASPWGCFSVAVVTNTSFLLLYSQNGPSATWDWAAIRWMAFAK